MQELVDSQPESAIVSRRDINLSEGWNQSFVTMSAATHQLIQSSTPIRISLQVQNSSEAKCKALATSLVSLTQQAAHSLLDTRLRSIKGYSLRTNGRTLFFIVSDSLLNRLLSGTCAAGAHHRPQATHHCRLPAATRPLASEPLVTRDVVCACFISSGVLQMWYNVPERVPVQCRAVQCWQHNCDPCDAPLNMHICLICGQHS